MSNELEKLKSDLEKLRAAYSVTIDMNCENIALGIKSLCNVVEKEINKQNDPWVSVKHVLNYWLEGQHPSSHEAFEVERKVAEYVRYLENKTYDKFGSGVFGEDELEIEITYPHKDYYCLKDSKGQMYRHLFNTVAIFATLEEAEFAAKHISDPGFEASVYTRNS